MAIDGQGGDAPTTYEDLAAFLVENPTADDLEDGLQPSDEPDNESDNSEESQGDKPDDQSAEDESEKKDESEDAEEQEAGKKFKVIVKGDDGADVTKEVTEKELTDGFMMRAEFTRKTQELARRESDAVQLVTKHIDEGREYFLKQAQVAHATVRQLAGLRDPQQMAALANENPGLWAQEVEREKLVGSALKQIEQSMQQESHQSVQMQTRKLQEDRATALAELESKDGLSNEKIGKIFQTVQKLYGFPVERFQQVREAGLVRMMRDAAAYQDLVSKRDAVKKKVADAPRLPPQRQPSSKRTEVTKRVNDKFRTGKAGLNDLAAYIRNSSR